MDNRRKDKRFEQQNKVDIQYAPQDGNLAGGETIQALTYNLSLSGAMILTTKSFPVDTIIRADIQLSDPDDVIRVDGKVKWIHDVEDDERFAIGVEFLHEISKTVLSLIRHLYSINEGVPSTIEKS